MNTKDLVEWQNRVGDIEEAIRILWSTLEAVHDAMWRKFATPKNYRDAIYGLSRQAYYLNEDERRQ